MGSRTVLNESVDSRDGTSGMTVRLTSSYLGTVGTCLVTQRV